MELGFHSSVPMETVWVPISVCPELQLPLPYLLAVTPPGLSPTFFCYDHPKRLLPQLGATPVPGADPGQAKLLENSGRMGGRNNFWGGMGG